LQEVVKGLLRWSLSQAATYIQKKHEKEKNIHLLNQKIKLI